MATESIEIGTAVVPIQTAPSDDHGAAGADHAGRVLAAGSRSASGPSHHWIISDQLGLPYDQPVRLVRDYVDVLDAAFAGPGAVDDRQPAPTRVHSPVDVTDSFAMPTLLAALGPTMLRIAGERTGGTILWMADERAIGDYVVPRITEAADAVGRTGIRVVAGVPVALCSDREVDDARAVRQRGARTCRLLPQLRSTARARRCRRRRRHHGRGRRVRRPCPTSPLPRCRCHRSRRPGGSARRRRQRDEARRDGALRSSSRH